MLNVVCSVELRRQRSISVWWWW